MQHNLTALYGGKGVGKSAVVRSAALYARARRLFPGGVYVVDVRGVTSTKDLGAVVAQTLGVSAEGLSAAERKVQLYARLAENGRTLLVLDRCEAAVQKCSKPLCWWLQDLCAITRASVVITSKLPLPEDADALFGQDLSVGEVELTALQPAEAAQLLSSSMRRYGPRLSATQVGLLELPRQLDCGGGDDDLGHVALVEDARIVEALANRPSLCAIGWLPSELLAVARALGADRTLLLDEALARERERGAPERQRVAAAVVSVGSQIQLSDRKKQLSHSIRGSASYASLASLAAAGASAHAPMPRVRNSADALAHSGHRLAAHQGFSPTAAHRRGDSVGSRAISGDFAYTPRAVPASASADTVMATLNSSLNNGEPLYASASTPKLTAALRNFPPVTRPRGNGDCSGDVPRSPSGSGLSLTPLAVLREVSEVSASRELDAGSSRGLLSDPAEGGRSHLAAERVVEALRVLSEELGADGLLSLPQLSPAVNSLGFARPVSRAELRALDKKLDTLYNMGYYSTIGLTCAASALALAVTIGRRGG
ncbi:hypothetical protein T492DRAFT_1098479 [Pavlovales sp. CCMP2436]|nr:hypothetical protein T492DRAFT_1098479 [Pavlovales sp. CCMP2436]